MTEAGHKRWAIPEGHIPLRSTGPEPECTSHDLLCILNISDADARTEITIYYSDREPVGPYRITVRARRVRHVRVNDLIDPEVIALDTDYAGLVESDVPVIVQFSRLDSSRAENAILSTMAFPVD